MKQIAHISNLLLVVLCIIFASFLYNAVTIREAISVDYSIPMAESFLSTKFLYVTSGDQIQDQFLFYPGASYILLTPFVLLGYPNLFGLFSWICLFIVCKKLGSIFGLNRYMAFLFAASICTTVSVLRTIGDQSVDKWLCIWFVLGIILLEKPQRNWKWGLLFGLCTGLLVGSKYSGPFFLLALVAVYWKTILHTLSPLRFVGASVVFGIFGLFWYVRNFILTGSPYFPAKLPFLAGNAEYTPGNWILGAVIIKYPPSIPPLANAFLSEYMIWAFSTLFIFWFLISRYRRQAILADQKIRRVLLLAFTTGIASLFLPITPAYEIELFHIISDMRYIYIFVLMLILATFLIVNKYQKGNLLAALTVLNGIMGFSFIPYKLEVFFICMVFIFLVYFKGKRFVEKIYNMAV